MWTRPSATVTPCDERVRATRGSQSASAEFGLIGSGPRHSPPSTTPLPAEPILVRVHIRAAAGHCTLEALAVLLGASTMPFPAPPAPPLPVNLPSPHRGSLIDCPARVLSPRPLEGPRSIAVPASRPLSRAARPKLSAVARVFPPPPGPELSSGRARAPNHHRHELRRQLWRGRLRPGRPRPP